MWLSGNVEEEEEDGVRGELVLLLAMTTCRITLVGEGGIRRGRRPLGIGDVDNDTLRDGDDDDDDDDDEREEEGGRFDVEVELDCAGVVNTADDDVDVEVPADATDDEVGTNDAVDKEDDDDNDDDEEEEAEKM